MANRTTPIVTSRLFLRSGCRLLLLMVGMAVAEVLTDNPFLGALGVLAIYVAVSALTLETPPADSFSAVASYRLFSRMSLYSTVAVELGVLMMFCHMLLVEVETTLIYKYLSMLGWVVTVYLLGGLYARYASRRWHGQALAEFVAGVAVWVAGDLLMLRATSLVGTLVWSGLWAAGIVLIFFSLNGFSRDFEAVGTLAGSPLDADALALSNRHTSHKATLVSSGVTMVVMVLWALAGQKVFAAPALPRVLHITMMQLPVLFMLVALAYAVVQPFDRRNREKLMLYIDSHATNPRIRASLQHQLVRGHKVSFWARLLCWVAMPFLRHKVVGREHLRKECYPSVFVCNHGFLYGPIVAALFLPTYFRPWIHDRMLREDLARREISRSFPWVNRLLGRRIGGALIALAARLTTRLLLSFRPIPVVRGASHDTMSTFEQSLSALAEGDNLMIFAEKPKRLNTGDNPDLRNLYTGFAHLGKLYHDATSRRLLFYPVYSSRRHRTITISAPVAYNPDLPPREAKQAVAEALQQQMEAMAKE